MERELTLPQTRAIARLRRRHPGAEVRVHPRPWGLVLESRRDERVLELARFDWDGAVMADQRVDRAA
jgi:hypothetical protein